LTRGADINALDERKNTPLHDAVSYMAMDVIGFLLERGADMNLKNDHEQTALHKAMLWIDKKSAIQCVQLFMERGFDVKKSADTNLLYEAIAREHKGIALLFLKKGIGFNDDALRASVNKGYADVFNILVERGANLFTNAYFDKQTNTCREFIYGGCGGVVPFADLDACRRICEEP
jgi:ankyrin repeat protein